MSLLIIFPRFVDSPCWPELGVTFSHLEVSGGLRVEDPTHSFQLMLEQMEDRLRKPMGNTEDQLPPSTNHKPTTEEEGQ